MRILVVEDDAKMAGLLRKALGEEGHEATIAYDGLKGLSFASTGSFDVLVLDVMLPGMDGFEITRRLRAASNRVPILMLTGRDANADIVHGLNVGADDYLTKPFSFQVLLARLVALTRRFAPGSDVPLRVDDLTLNRDAHEVHRGRRVVALTRTEFAILECLMQNAGRVVSRPSLIESVWGHERDVESNTLDVFIRSVRSKVDPDESKRLIHTVRGVGYILREPRGDE
jgi:DNA-binding response OmpR family regulator